MLIEPAEKHACIFIDGQNLFKSAREAFGYSYPNYDIKKLVENICGSLSLKIANINFYTGIPKYSDNPLWNQFWCNKLVSMGQQGINVFKRYLRYRNKKIKLPDNTEYTLLVGQEKGIDVRIAVDIIRCIIKKECDVVVILSQDQDLSEVADEFRIIAAEQKRWIKIVSAYPYSPTSSNHRGINKTDWFKINKSFYDDCVDKREYRPPKN